jgi:hypothetical protein
MDHDLEKQTALALGSTWGIEPEIGEFDRSAVIELLSGRILEWLETDFERLVNTMYKLDIPENKFHQAMGLSDPQRIAPEIAELVWERELQRAWFRRKYS